MRLSPNFVVYTRRIIGVVTQYGRKLERGLRPHDDARSGVGALCNALTGTCYHEVTSENTVPGLAPVDAVAWSRIRPAHFFCRLVQPLRRLIVLVPEKGIEPSRPCGHRILSPTRLPLPPLRRGNFECPGATVYTATLVPEKGIEPSRPCGHRILSP